MKGVRYFGEELVVFRGEDGAVGLIDAYCEIWARIWPMAERFRAMPSCALSMAGAGTDVLRR